MTFGPRKVLQLYASNNDGATNSSTVVDAAHRWSSTNKAMGSDPSLEPALKQETPATINPEVATPADAQSTPVTATITQLHAATQTPIINTTQATQAIAPLETAIAAENNSAGKVAEFATQVAVPASYSHLREALSPLHENAEKARSPFVEAVRNNPLAKFLGISFIPALPLTFHALTSMTKRDKVLAEISATQTQFSRNIIQDGSLTGLLERTETALPLLLGVKHADLFAEENSASPAALAVALASRLIIHRANLDTGNSGELRGGVFTGPTFSHEDIEQARAQIREVRAFISGEPGVVNEKVTEGDTPTAFKKLISVMSGGPALLGTKFKGGEVDSLIKAVMPEETARALGAKLGEVGSKLQNALGTHAEKVQGATQGLGERLEASRREITTEATNTVLNHLQAVAKDPNVHTAAREAHSAVTSTASTIAKGLPGALEKGLSALKAALNIIQPKAANDDRYHKTA